MDSCMSHRKEKALIDEMTIASANDNGFEVNIIFLRFIEQQIKEKVKSEWYSFHKIKTSGQETRKLQHFASYMNECIF